MRFQTFNTNQENRKNYKRKPPPQLSHASLANGHALYRWTEAEAGRLGIPYLGDLPLDAAMREGGDAGVPVVVSDPDGEIADRFAVFAEALAKKLDL